MSRRRGLVKIDGLPAGIIEQSEDGDFIFSYDPTYLKSPGAKSISLTLPLREQPYTSRVLFPFFDGLIPEGWLLQVAVDKWRLKSNDRMGLLLTVCRDCIGAVDVEDIPG